MSEHSDPRGRWLTFLAAVLFGIGVLTGPLVALAMTGDIDADAGSMLAAHLNALLGCFWMLGVAWTLPRCNLSGKLLLALVVLLVLGNYANWTITVLKAFWKVKGVAYLGGEGQGANNIITTLLLLFVVLPSLGAAALWAWGLRPWAVTKTSVDSSGTASAS